MSHFTVLVMGPNLNDEDVLAKTLQPFHEYECTGEADEYVRHVDFTEECLAEYGKSKETMLEMPDGERFEYHKKTTEFYRPATPAEIELIKARKFEGSYSRHGEDFTVLELPKDAKKVSVPTSELRSVKEWLEDYYGISEFYEDEPAEKPEGAYAIVKDGVLVKAFKFTNPNSKWDWWLLGGRWTGGILVKPGMEKHAKAGSPGLFTQSSDNFDLARKDAIDKDRMQERQISYRKEDWKKTLEMFGERAPDLTEAEIDKLRYELLTAFNLHRPEWLKIKGERPDFDAFLSERVSEELRLHVRLTPIFFATGINNSGKFEKIQDWINAAPWIETYAMLVDGNWTGRGEMGFFGISSNDEDPYVWQTKTLEAIEALPDDHYLAVVDCHI